MSIRRIRTLGIPLLSIGLLSACGADSSGQDSSGQDSSGHDSSGQGGDFAVPVLVANSAHDLRLPRAWHLIGNEVTVGHDTLAVEITSSAAGVGEVLAWIDGDYRGALQAAAPGAWTTGIGDLAPGSHTLTLSADGGTTAFAEADFYRSHPLYIVVSIDWDRSNTQTQELYWQDGLHRAHPALRLTHFVGPYTFTDPDVSAARAGELVTWLTDNVATFDDEIGLHIHPYCHFVEFAGVPCRTTPSYVWKGGDSTGYTVLSSAYEQGEFETLLESAVELFGQHGLGRPTTYRAGGWIASASVLRALDNTGFVADTSALNVRLIDEWENQEAEGPQFNSELWDWNAAHWDKIHDTSQPYHPDPNDPQVPGDPGLSLLEVPDNAGLADYLDAAETIAIIQANWQSAPLTVPAVVSMGYHNSTDADIRLSVEGSLDHIDQFLAESGGGPMVYATLNEIPRVFP